MKTTPLGATAALDDGTRTWHRDALQAEVDALTARFMAQRTQVLATLMDNGSAWVVDAPFGRVFSRFCDADVGDARCGVDLEAGAFRGVGAVTQVMDARTLRASGLGAFADGWFTRGRIAWDVGGAVDVAAHRVAGDHVTIELTTPAEFESGDAFVITAGCDKRAETCRTKFANISAFRGFPHMPGNDAILAGPDSRVPMDGGSRFR